MKEKTLIKISLLCSIIGLIGLFLFSTNIEAKVVSIDELTPDDIGLNKKICGTISSKYVSKNNHVFIGLKDTSGEITLVIFNSSINKLGVDIYKLETSQSICALGKVDVYKNELEIIPKEIELL